MLSSMKLAEDTEGLAPEVAQRNVVVDELGMMREALLGETGATAAAPGGTADDRGGHVMRERLVGEMGADKLIPWVEPPLVV